MKKLEDNGILSLIGGIVTVVWFGYAGRLILAADIGIIPKALLILVGIWFAIDHIYYHHMNEDNE